MTPVTRMAMEQSTAIPAPASLAGTDARYETIKRQVNDAPVEVTYEVSWIPERQCWRRFLRSIRPVQA